MAGHVFENKFFDVYDIEDDKLVWREPPSTNFLDNDEIPATLVPILKRIVEAITPNLEAVIDQLDEYGETKPASTLLPKPLIKKVSFT